MSELVEIVARVIDPGAWEVMDFAEKKMREKYAGKDVGWPADQFKHKESMNLALAALRAIEGAGYKVVGREPSRQMWAASGDAVCDLQRRHIGNHDKITEAVWQAAFGAAPTVGGE